MATEGNAELVLELARASNERELARVVAAARLLVPLREDAGGGRGLWATTDDGGRAQVVAFTAAAAVEAWAGHPTPYAVMPGAEVCEIALNAGATALWIDPGARHGLRLEPRIVEIVARG